MTWKQHLCRTQTNSVPPRAHMFCSVCGVETLLAIFHCCILAVFVESKGGMRYYALVVLYTFGQTEQKDLVFQLWACSTRRGGRKHHNAGKHGKVWTINLWKTGKQNRFMWCFSQQEEQRLHVNQRNLNRQETIGKISPFLWVNAVCQPFAPWDSRINSGLGHKRKWG